MNRIKNENRDELYAEKLFKYGYVEVQDIVAHYPGTERYGRPVLDKVSLEIKAGEKIGVVGRTGAGKSSFIKLIPRLLIPTSGRIKIDG